MGLLYSNLANLSRALVRGKIMAYMFYSISVYWKDRWIWVPAIFLLFFQLFMWIYGAFFIHPTTDQIFLHYNVVFGVDLIGEWWKIFAAPIGGLTIFLCNFLLSWYLYGQDKVLSRFLTFAAGLLNFGLALALYLTVGLNI